MRQSFLQSLLMGFAVLLLCASPVRAEIKSEVLEYRVGDRVFKGQLVYDDKIDSKRPGVLVVHEWYGLNDYARTRARMLAELGYVALAVDMYGDARNASSVEEASQWAGALKNDRREMRARINAAYGALAGHSNVDRSRIAVMGYCFGGTVALELARSGADIKGAVSFHGGLATPNPEDAKDIKGKVLVFHGGDDPFVPPTEVAAFNEEMRAAKVDYTVTIFGGAVHTFTNPAADKANMKGVAYHAAADRRSWAWTKDFFAEVFAK